MNNDEFERFVLKFGKDILRFCRMTAGDAENGDELYQDTMLKLLEKKKRLDSMQNTKSYALSTSIYLWKNKKKKYANRMRLVPIDSMDVMSDEGYGFTDYDNEVSPEHYTGMNVADNRTAAGFYIGGTWSVNGRSPEWLENTFDGEVIDSHTFAGMLKIDLVEKHTGSGELSLNVNGLGYDDDRMLDGEEISASHWTDGSWNIVIPFAVNTTDVKTIEVGEKKGNITLEDVVVSPYQVIVHVTTPGEQRELTDDRREKLLSKDPDMTDAEMFELLGWSYEPCYTICFNQDGELLYPDTEMAGRAGFAVQGKEIKTLHVFIFDNLDDWSLMEQEGMNSSAADRAVITKGIHVE